MITLPLCSCNHTANDHMLFRGGTCLARGCMCRTYDKMEAYAKALILAETMSTIELLVDKLNIDRTTAIELIDQIDDDDVLAQLIDGEFDHMPSPAAAALHAADARSDLIVDQMVQEFQP